MHYRGVVQVAPIKRIFLFRSWYSLLIEISGSSLLIESLPHTKKEMMTMTMQRSMSNDDEDDLAVAMHGEYDLEHSFNTSTSVSSYHSDTGCNDDNSYSDQPTISERESHRLFAQDAILKAAYAAEIYGLSDSYVSRYMPSSTGRRRNSSCSSSHDHGLGQAVAARDTRPAVGPSTPLPTHHSASTPSSSSSSRPFLSFSTGPVRRALDERLVGTSRSIDMHLVRSVEIGKSSIRSSSQQGLSSNYYSMHVEVRVLYTADARDATVGHSNAVTSRDSICKSDANTSSSSSSIFITPHRHTSNTSHIAANTRVNSCSNNSRSPAWDYDCDVLQRDDGEKKRREEKLESVWFKLPVVAVHEESEREQQRINSSSSGVLHLQRFLLILLCVNDSIEVYSRKRKSSAKVFHRSSEDIRYYITSLLHSTHSSSSSSRSTDVIVSRAALDYSVVDRAPSPSISSPSTSTMIMYQQTSRSRSTSPKGSTFTSRRPSPMHSSGGPLLLQGGASQSYCMSSSLSALTSIESLMGATSQQQQQQSMSASSSSSSSSSHYSSNSSFLSVASQSTTPGAVVVMNRGQALKSSLLLSTQYEDQDNDPTASSSNCISHDQLLSSTTNVRQWLQVARRYSEGCDPSVAAEDYADEDATTIADAPDDKGTVNPTSPPATRTGIEESRISSAPSSSSSSSSSMMQRGYWKNKSFSDCRPPSSSSTFGSSSPTRRSMTDRKASSSSSSVQHHPFHLDRRSRAGTLLPTADVYERKGEAIEADADAASSYCCDSVAAFQAMYQRTYSGGDHTMGSVTAAPYLRPFLGLEPLIICDGDDRDGDDRDGDDDSGEGDMMTSHDDDAFEDSTHPSRHPKSSSFSSYVSIQAMHRAVEECVRSPCQLKRELCNSRQRRDKIEKR